MVSPTAARPTFHGTLDPDYRSGGIPSECPLRIAETFEGAAFDPWGGICQVPLRSAVLGRLPMGAAYLR